MTNNRAPLLKHVIPLLKSVIPFLNRLAPLFSNLTPLSVNPAPLSGRVAPLHARTAPFVVAASCVVLLSSCQTGTNPDTATKTPPPTATTGTNPAAVKPVAVAPSPVPSPPPPSVRRGLLLKRYPPAGANDYEDEPQAPRGPQYDARRLAKAAQVRVCEPPVKLEEYGTKCALRTKWENGRITVSLQMTGPREALQGLLQSVSQFRVKLQDPLGNDLTEYTLLPQDFKWASGRGSMAFFESDAEMPLETYERILNWHFFYDY